MTLKKGDWVLFYEDSGFVWSKRLGKVYCTKNDFISISCSRRPGDTFMGNLIVMPFDTQNILQYCQKITPSKLLDLVLNE